MTQLMDLPAELLRKIVSLLPLLDRVRIEAVSKEFLEFSRVDAVCIELHLPKKEDPTGLLLWLKLLQKTSASSIQKLIMSSNVVISPDALSLHQFQNLIHLDLHRRHLCRGSSINTGNLSSLCSLTKLKHLAFTLTHQGRSEDLLLYTADFSELSSLVRLQSLTMLAAMQQRLRIQFCREITGLKNLTELRIQGRHEVILNDAFAQLTTALSVLELWCEDPKQKVFEASHMMSLELQCNTLPFRLSDSLKELVLREFDISLFSLDSLRGLVGLTSLSLLTPYATVFHCTSLRTQLSHLTALKRMLLSGVWHGGSSLLSPFTVLPRLTSLQFYGHDLELTDSTSIPFYNLLQSSECFESLMNLEVLLRPGADKLEVDLAGLPNLGALNLRDAVIVTSMLSTTLTDLYLRLPYTPSSILSICADFMRGVRFLESLTLDFFSEVVKEETAWFIASLRSLDRLKSLNLRSLVGKERDPAKNLFSDLVPAFSCLKALVTLEVTAPAAEIKLRRSFIPSLRRLALHCADLTMCLSCTMCDAMVVHLQGGNKSRDHLSNRLHRSPGLRIMSDSKGLNIVKYNVQTEVWTPENVILKDVLNDFLGSPP